MAANVEVMVRPLLDAPQGLQLRQDDGGQVQIVEQGEATQWIRSSKHLPQLGQLALTGGLGGT